MNIDRQLFRAGLLVASGLLLQSISLVPLHPLAFVAFVGVGLPITLAGVVLFLFALLR